MNTTFDEHDLYPNINVKVHKVGDTRGVQEETVAARNSQKQPRASGSSQEEPGASRGS